MQTRVGIISRLSAAICAKAAGQLRAVMYASIVVRLLKNEPSQTDMKTKTAIEASVEP